jgi:hypothetical protein
MYSKHWLGQGYRSRYNDYATGWTVLGLNPVEARDFSILHNVKTGSGVHTATFRGSFLQLMVRWRDTDHSLLCGAEDKNMWRYTYTPYIGLHGVDKDNFTILAAKIHAVCV